MLISKVADEGGDKGKSEVSVDDDAHECQTANELFDFMVNNQNFNINDGDTITPRDLVLLYKNTDLGTKLMPAANEFQHVKPNQYVETVVYDESDESDISDIYSNEDLQNIFLINKERLDLFNNQSSIENTLCHKFGDLEMRAVSNCEYDKQFLFRDPHIKEQLKRLNLMTTNQIDGTIQLPSLLDYVCCKRLEDNYNFYMENIILYVKNTIEQLKRISNGDYLTDRVKEKWREVGHVNDDIYNTEVLATSTSIPLHVECQFSVQRSTWDDLVHSAVDIRSLSKILERKIVLEIPRLIRGSYKLLGKCDNDNLVISCKQDNETMESKESRVNVMFQLKRSEAGHVKDNINSIMILQTVPMVQVPDTPLALMYKDKATCENLYYADGGNHIKITELSSAENDVQTSNAKVANDPKLQIAYSNDIDYETEDNQFHQSHDTQSYQGAINDYHTVLYNNDNRENQIAHRDPFEIRPNDLQMTIQKMMMQSIVPEESVEDVTQSRPTRKKSPKVRIKSPYENKSHYIEEKRRRKLLEIRERRERKKMALAESCKITKHKYGKGSVMPQASSSVTKLSITNKSFYNSIYGQNGSVEPKQLKHKIPKLESKKETIGALGKLDSEQESTIEIPLTDSKKSLDRSYYLDDTVTEMMLVNMKQDECDEKEKATCLASTSSDYRTNLKILSQLITPSDSDINVVNFDGNVCCDKAPKQQVGCTDDYETKRENSLKMLGSQDSVNVVPWNSPKKVTTFEVDSKELKKITSSVECRKSIDKIYQLMKDLENQKGLDDECQKHVTNNLDVIMVKASSTVQGSDSGTSLKHHLTSSNPSTFSFDKDNNTDVSKYCNKRSVISKVVISSKSQIPKIDTEKAGREPKRHRVAVSPKIQENPLKAISQLLHEFENIQKNRIKHGIDQKPVKKTDTALSNEGKTLQRQGLYKRQSRLEQHTDSVNKYDKASKDKKNRYLYPKMDVIKRSYQPIPADDKYADNKKKINDILDEAKEARGEAVKGPSKFNSRLNSLAQPKRIYVKAHSEEYQTRYGRNLITDRLQRLAAAPSQFLVDRTTGLANTRNKTKRTNNDMLSTIPLKLNQSELPIEPQSLRSRYQSTNNSPARKEQTLKEHRPSCKVINELKTPEIPKKNMVAAKSYLKSYYTPTCFSTVPNELQYIQKTRTPLLPGDIDIASITSSLSHKESMKVGSKLHHVINSIIQSMPPDLESLEVCHEVNSKIISNKNLSTCDERTSIDSDYSTSIIDEGSNYKNKSSKDAQSNGWTETGAKKLDFKFCNLQPYESMAPLKENEKVFDNPLTLGHFSPKPSMQKIIFLQSSDTDSMVIKASLSKNLQTDMLLDLKAEPILSKLGLKWSLKNIPLQISTVGYAFPEFGYNCRSLTLCNLFDNVSKSNNEDIFLSKSFKTYHNYNSSKDHHAEQTHLNQNVYADGHEFTRISKYQNSDTNNMDSNKIDVQKVANSNSDHFQKVETESTIKEDKHPKNRKLDEIKSSVITSKSQDNIDYTTSLDILVGLLNEIKKITTCQARLANNVNEESQELQTILKKSLLESSFQSSCFDEVSVNEMSVSSLEKLRCLESESSLYSYYISDNERHNTYGNIKHNVSAWYDTRNGSCCKSIFADKEVNVDIAEKEYVSRLTDVPSIFFPITINRTTLTDSIIGGYDQSSRLFSLTEFHSTNPTHATVINLNAPSKKIARTLNIEDVNLSIVKNSSMLLCAMNELESYRENQTSKKGVQKRVKQLNNYLLEGSNFDPIMKMKRDILVTVYSMLVLTVFAALSFPEVLYHV